MYFVELRELNGRLAQFSVKNKQNIVVNLALAIGIYALCVCSIVRAYGMFRICALLVFILFLEIFKLPVPMDRPTTP